MRKSLLIIPGLLLFAAIGTPIAIADTITDGTLNFTVSTGKPTPTGSFVFDNTTSTFMSFVVSWNGELFDFTSAANFTVNSFPNLPAPSHPDYWAVCDLYVSDPSACPNGSPGRFFLAIPNVVDASITAITPSNMPENYHLRDTLGVDAVLDRKGNAMERTDRRARTKTNPDVTFRQFLQ